MYLIRNKLHVYTCIGVDNFQSQVETLHVWCVGLYVVFWALASLYGVVCLGWDVCAGWDYLSFFPLHFLSLCAMHMYMYIFSYT